MLSDTTAFETPFTECLSHSLSQTSPTRVPTVALFPNCRLVFMDKGTQVICIGSPIDLQRPDNSNWLYTSFFEIPRYFDSGDVRFQKVGGVG